MYVAHAVVCFHPPCRAYYGDDLAGLSNKVGAPVSYVEAEDRLKVQVEAARATIASDKMDRILEDARRSVASVSALLKRSLRSHCKCFQCRSTRTFAAAAVTTCLRCKEPNWRFAGQATFIQCWNVVPGSSAPSHAWLALHCRLSAVPCARQHSLLLSELVCAHICWCLLLAGVQ